MPDPLDPPPVDLRPGPDPTGSLTAGPTGSTDPAAADPPGWVPPPLLGGYRLLDLLGRGGMGLVFRAEDPRLGREVAVKVMRPGAGGAGGKARFLREARAQARVEHDHVVPVYAADEEGGVPYLVMPVLHGQTLAARLRAGRPPLAEVLRVAREAAEGVAAAHAADLVHRDIKPANIWVEESGRVRLMDFGLARAAAGGGETWTGAVVGTPGYMAPEQARGEVADYRTDLFGLGCVLYEMAAGARPAAPSGSGRAAPPDLRSPAGPPALAALIWAMLAHDPTARPASAAAVAAEVRRIEAGIARRAGRRRAAVAAGVAAAVLAVGVAVAAARRLNRPADPPDPAAVAGVAPAAGELPPPDRGWAERVGRLPPAERVEAVRAELVRRNPGLTAGQVNCQTWNGGKTYKALIHSERVADLAPLRLVPGLDDLECYGQGRATRGRLASLDSVRGLPLAKAGFSYNPVRDLSPLAGMPLRCLWLSGIDATDFGPVYGLRQLTVLHLYSLDPAARVDVGRLVGMPLADVWLDPAQCDDFEALREVPTLAVINGRPAAEFWKAYDAGRR